MVVLAARPNFGDVVNTDRAVRVWMFLAVHTSDWTPASKMPPHSPLRQDLVALLPRLRRFALALTRNPGEADDLVQDACAKALGNADSWDATQGLDRWVFRILRNQWISDLRKRQVRLGQGHVDASESDELQTHLTGEDALALTQLMGQLAALPSAYSSTLLLISVEGYTYQEAAELLNVPIGTIMSRLHRARQMLATQLKISKAVS